VNLAATGLKRILKPLQKTLWQALLGAREEEPEPVATEPILRRLSDEEVALVEAAELFNQSQFRRTVSGVARSLGPPRVSSTSRWAATVAPRRVASGAPLLDDPAWSRASAAAREPGPAFWTGHCGGAPLSPHAVWGNGDRRVVSCPRHSGASRPWSRVWSEAEVAAAFGGAVDDLSVEWPDGVWTLEVRAGGSARPWRYDGAHRALAAALGWGALPSPATRVVRTNGGWRAEGFGLGHRVGLCLADDGHPWAMR